MEGDQASSRSSQKVSTKILQPVLLLLLGVIFGPHASGVDRSVLHKHKGVGGGLVIGEGLYIFFSQCCPGIIITRAEDTLFTINLEIAWETNLNCQLFTLGTTSHS